jgi:hypothetical protein
MIHLVDHTYILGPTCMHYMYSYECHMVVMKGYICNCAHPEGLCMQLCSS